LTEKRGRTKDQIAAALKVQQLVFVTVRPSSTELSVEVELFDADRQTLWTGTFTAAGLLQSSPLRSNLIAAILEQLGVPSESVELHSPPTNEEAYRQYLIGLSLMQRGTVVSVSQGMEYLNTALRYDSLFTLAYAARAQAAVQLFKLGGEVNKDLLNAAFVDLQIAAQRQESALAYQVLGEILQYRQKFTEAKEALQKSLALQPGNAVCYRELAFLALAEGAYDQAEEYMKTAGRLDPNNPETPLTAGLVAHFRKEYEQALNLYNEAIALGANDSLVTTRYRLNAWAVLEMRKEAELYCKQLQQRYPESYRTNYWIARALQQLGQWDESKPYLEKALQLAEKEREVHPADLTVRGFLTLIKARLGKLDEAQKEVDLAIQMHGSNAEILYRRANVYAIQGQQGRAKVFNALKAAVAAEFKPAEIFSPDFVSIMKEPEFTQAIIRSPSSQ
jgi:tetratricopeptide (TPR) repeat protein